VVAIMRILGLDVGDARIGVSMSDELGLTGHGLCVIERKGLKHDIRAIQQIIAENNVEKLVIGLPKTLSGEIGIQAQKVIKFADSLSKKLNIPIVMWDERLTTVAANRILRESGVPPKKRKKVIDQLAASIILDTYMERERGAKRQGG